MNSPFVLPKITSLSVLSFFSVVIVTSLLCTSFIGCSSDSASSPTDTNVLQTKKAAVSTYADNLYAVYSDVVETAQQMRIAIQNFTNAPSESTLLQAKQAWLKAREVYGKSEAARFYGGPIDNENGPEGRINAWPLDEQFIDYVVGAPQAGIIAKTAEFPVISKELLASLNEKGGETNISTGYHAIEFLLWGQDLTEPSENKPGQRSFTDYTTAPHAERRKQYLQAVTDLLLDDLQSVRDAWNPATSGNYRAQFLAMSPDSALAKILTGIGSLSNGELAGERMTVALKSADQEDEHSCFSDNTHIDILENMNGIVDVWTGKYTRINGQTLSGTGLNALVRSINPTLEAQTSSTFTASLSAISAIGSPFDYAISASNPTGNQRVNTAIQALKAQSVNIAKVAEALKLTINISE